MKDYKYNKGMKVKEVVSKKLTELREERGWTQKEVASMLNISQRAYSHYENGSRSLPLEMLVDIADLYDVSADFLLADSDAGRE